MHYCQQQSEKYEALVGKALKSKQPISQQIKDKMMLFKGQVIQMTAAIENEQVSLDKYMEYLQRGLKHDQVLLKYFEDTGNESKAKIVRFRIE